MDENILKLRVGFFVVITTLILGILIFLNSEGWSRQYTLFIKPVSAPGVTVGTPIRKNGILVGRVKSVSTEDTHLLLGLAINEGQFLYANEVPSIGTESFLGDAVIEFVPMPADARGVRMVEGDVFAKVAVKRNPMEIVDVAINLEKDISRTMETIRMAGEAVDEAGAGVKRLLDTVNGTLEDEDSEFKRLVVDFRQTSLKAQVAIDNFNRIFENMNEIVGDPKMKSDLRNAIATLPKIFEEIRVTVGDTRQTINSFQSVTGKASKNLDNLEVFTGSLKNNGPEILVQVGDSLKNIDELVSNISTFTQSLSKLENKDGTLGKLLNDSELYDEVLKTVENVRDLSTRLEPMVNDLRVFADVLARDPGVIGVRGAIDRRPGNTGYKGTAARDGGIQR